MPVTRYPNPADVQPRQDLTYNGDGTLATVIDYNAAGTAIRTTTLTYTSGNLTSTVEVGPAGTITTTLTYTGASLTRVTRG